MSDDGKSEITKYEACVGVSWFSPLDPVINLCCVVLDVHICQIEILKYIQAGLLISQ